jgi:hypothetical protein
VLTRRHLGQAALLPQRLHLQERDERVHLLLHRLEAHQAVELGLQLLQALLVFDLPGPFRLKTLELVGQPLALRPRALAQPLAEHAERAAGFVQRVSRHEPDGTPRRASRC